MTNTASPAQVQYLKDLLAKQAVFNRDRSIAVWNELKGLEAEGLLTSQVATQAIDAVNQAIRVQARTEEGKRLLESTKPKRVEVSEGRYAVRDSKDETSVKFYRVKRYDSGAVLVYVMASDDEYRVFKSAAREVLARIVDAGIPESLALYGQEIGACGVCGRTLTDDESRARGIGPTCMSKL